MVDEFPSNAKHTKEVRSPTRDVKKVERIASGTVVRRKKPLGRRFTETFAGEDAEGVWSYVFFDVMIPAVKDMVADATSTGIERMLFGSSRAPSRRGTSRYSTPGGYGSVAYNRMSSGPSNRHAPRDEPRALSRRGRTLHDFDEIILATRVEAEEVLDQLFELVDKYHAATVGDLYDMVGIDQKYTDDKWGWSELRGAGVTRVRNGYLLDLPKPEPLD